MVSPLLVDTIVLAKRIGGRAISYSIGYLAARRRLSGVVFLLDKSKGLLSAARNVYF